MANPELTIRIGANSSLFRKELDRVEKQALKHSKFLDTLDKDQKTVFLARERKLQQQRIALINKTAIAFTASIAGGAAAVKQFARYETAVVAASRTTGLAGEELDKFRDKIEKLSEKLGRPQEQLLGIAEAAGTLGIQGVDDLAKFTETMAKFDIASATLRGGEAATAIARIINLTGGSIGNVERFGSEIAFLADNFKATEAEIAANSEELSRINPKFKLSTQNTIALAAAFADFGITPEIARTGVSKFASALDEALRDGGQKLNVFMRLTGMTKEELEKTFQESPEKIFTSFSEGLGRTGKDATRVLSVLGLNQDRLAGLFLASAQNSDVLTRAISEGNKAFEENTKLQQETEKALATTEERFNASKVAIQNMGIQLGSTLAPAVIGFAELTTKRLKQIQDGFTALGDIIRNLKIIFDEVELAMQRMLARITLSLEETLNKIPGVVVDFGDSLERSFEKINELEISLKARGAVTEGFFTGGGDPVAAMKEQHSKEQQLLAEHEQAKLQIKKDGKAEADSIGVGDLFLMTQEEFDGKLAQLEERLQMAVDAENAAEILKISNQKETLKEQARTNKLKVDNERAVSESKIKIAQLENVQKIGQLKEFFGEHTAAYKALFLVEKAGAIARSIVATNVAYVEALAHPPGPPTTIPIANAARLSGHLSTASIAATAIQGLASFDVGAMNVPRDMIAQIHQGETILPKPFAEEFRQSLQNGGGMGQNVSVQIDLTERASQFVTVNQRQDSKLGVQR